MRLELLVITRGLHTNSKTVAHEFMTSIYHVRKGSRLMSCWSIGASQVLWWSDYSVGWLKSTQSKTTNNRILLIQAARHGCKCRGKGRQHEGEQSSMTSLFRSAAPVGCATVCDMANDTSYGGQRGKQLLNSLYTTCSGSRWALTEGP
jgi:hypothetical protein